MQAKMDLEKSLCFLKTFSRVCHACFQISKQSTKITEKISYEPTWIYITKKGTHAYQRNGSDPPIKPRTQSFRTLSYGTLWYHMVPFGTIWYHMVPYGSIRYLMVPYSTLWYHRIPYGTIGYPMVP